MLEKGRFSTALEEILLSNQYTRVEFDTQRSLEVVLLELAPGVSLRRVSALPS